MTPRWMFVFAALAFLLGGTMHRAAEYLLPTGEAVVFVDQDSGCHYLVSRGAGGISVRYDQNGREIMGCRHP